MSKPRFNWWGQAQNIIRDYPDRKRNYDALKASMPALGVEGGRPTGGKRRPVERTAMNAMPYGVQKEYNAVSQALKTTKQMEDGDLRLDIVKNSFWKGLNIWDVAHQVKQGDRTVRRLRWEFILLVGHCYGHIDEEEYRYYMKKTH